MQHPAEMETTAVARASQPPERLETRLPLHERWRGVERKLKRRAFHALGRLLATQQACAAPDWSGRQHRVLFLRHDRIGDMVLTTGILKAIRVAQPNVTMDVLASTRNAAVLDHNPYVGTVHRLDRSRPWRLLLTLWRVRRARYDAVIDPMVTAPSLTTMLLMWACGASHRIGAGGRGNDYVLTVKVERIRGATHFVDHLAALLAAFGISPQAPPVDRAPSPTRRSESCTGWGIWRPALFLTPDETGFGERLWRAADQAAFPEVERSAVCRLIVNVSAGSWWRYWPEDHFISAVTRIRAIYPHISVVVVGAARDAARMGRIGRGLGVRVAHGTTLRQLLALIATSDVVLTADTSVTHIGAAFSKVVLALYARSGGTNWGPYGTIGRTVSTPSVSLEQLRVEPVVEALVDLLAERQSAIGANGSPSLQHELSVRAGPQPDRESKNTSSATPLDNVCTLPCG